VRLVVPAGDGTWRVVAPGSKRASATSETRSEAEARGREILRNAGGGELRVYEDDGALLATHAVHAPSSPSARGSKTYRLPRGTHAGG
jgi:hypothetical protein